MSDVVRIDNHRAAREVQLTTGATYVTALAEVRRRRARGELDGYMMRVAQLDPPPGGVEDLPRCVRCLQLLTFDKRRYLLVHNDETPAGRCT